jgi:hypothetical protein
VWPKAGVKFGSVAAKEINLLRDVKIESYNSQRGYRCA